MEGGQMSERDQAPRYRIADLAVGDRPRERLAKDGAHVLSNTELIAILLRSGIEGLSALDLAESLLVEFGGLIGLHQVGYEELCSRRGVGPAKAAQLKAAIELGRRLSQASPEARAVVQSPQDAAALLQYEMGALDQETLRVILLDTRNRLLRTSEVYRGSLNTSLIRVGEVFREAIRVNAAAIIIAHNHPSGDPTPSPEDAAVTRAFAEAGRLLDIDVLDHLVIGRGSYVSMKSKGLGFD
jgi:DNA repair protein RadC